MPYRTWLSLSLCMLRYMAERGVFVRTTWKQLLLKMESTLRLRSSGSVCWLTELPEVLGVGGLHLRCMYVYMYVISEISQRVL